MPTPYSPTDRRPIGARGWRISHRTASWLAQRGVSPNAISVAGMLAAIAAGGAVAATSYLPDWERWLWLAAVVLVPLRLLANMLDGMVAIETNRASRLGELFNEVPDRVSDAAVLIGLGYAHGSEPALGYLAALGAIFTAYVRAVGKVTGSPQFFQGPMAKPERMWLVTAFCVYAAIAPHTLAKPTPDNALAPPSWLLVLIVFGCVVTTARRLYLIRNALKEPAA